MKNYVAIGVVILLAIVGFFIWNSQSAKQNTNTQSTASSTELPQTQVETGNINFSNPKKSAHYESNTPSHGAILASVPINIVIDFNFDLAKPSEIKILNKGKDYGVGETIIDSNNLSMRRNLSSDSPEGLYTVEYKACWPDGSCHEGNFQYALDRSKAASFDDQTSKKEVLIKLSDIQFKPQNIKISKGTKVTWINDEQTGHYVNTDSHPAHTYYQQQNSKVLRKGEQYSVVFDTAGIYPYHCSAHAGSMVGTLLVE